MTASFEIDSPIVFTTGTVGEPGHRVFYLQAQGDGLVVTLKVEKQQVGALAEYLSGLLADLPTVDEGNVPTLLELIGPVVPEWIVGTLKVAWDDLNDRMVLVAEELLTEEDVEAGTEPATASFRLNARAGWRASSSAPATSWRADVLRVHCAAARSTLKVTRALG